MRKMEMKVFFRITFLVGLVMLLYGVSTYAVEVLPTPKMPPAPKTFDFKTALTGENDISRYEISVVPAPPTASPSVKVEGSTMKVTVYVPESGGTQGSIVRGIQLNLSLMRNIGLEFYDKGYKIGEETIGDQSANVLSPPTNGNTLIVKVRRNTPDSPIYSSESTPIFSLRYISYIITKNEIGERTVECWSLPFFQNHSSVTTFRQLMKQYGNLRDYPATGSAVIPVNNPTNWNFYLNNTSSVLYYSTHSNPFRIQYAMPSSFFELNELSNGVFRSNVDWMFQVSCRIVNANAAEKWCDYLKGDLGFNRTKGLFGYAELEETVSFDENFIKYSQIRPMLDTYMNTTAKRFANMTNGRINNRTLEFMAHSTVIINVDNIKDSMFNVSNPTDGDSTYRIYKYQNVFESLPITTKSLGGVRIAGNTYQFGVGPKTSADKAIHLNIVKPHTGVMSLQNLANHLNSISTDAFDALMRNSIGRKVTNPDGSETIYTSDYDMDNMFEEIKELRVANPMAYKQYVLNWLTSGSPGHALEAKRPMVTSIKCVNGYPEVRYAELVNTSTGYKYVRDTNGKIIWKTEVLKGYTLSEEVALQ